MMGRNIRAPGGKRRTFYLLIFLTFQVPTPAPGFCRQGGTKETTSGNLTAVCCIDTRKRNDFLQFYIKFLLLFFLMYFLMYINYIYSFLVSELYVNYITFTHSQILKHDRIKKYVKRNVKYI